MCKSKDEMFEKILFLRGEIERINLEIAILHQDIVEADLREMGIQL